MRICIPERPAQTNIKILRRASTISLQDLRNNMTSFQKAIIVLLVLSVILFSWLGFLFRDSCLSNSFLVQKQQILDEKKLNLEQAKFEYEKSLSVIDTCSVTMGPATFPILIDKKNNRVYRIAMENGTISALQMMPFYSIEKETVKEQNEL